MVQNLRHILENPPSLGVSIGSDFIESTNDISNLNEHVDISGIMDSGADGIDWDITMDSSQIDWDIGTVEETDDAANGFGTYEIIDAKEALQDSSTNENETFGEAAPSGGGSVDVEVSEISWNVSVENPILETNEDSGNRCTDGVQISSLNSSAEAQISGDRSPLLETEYRNKILDDLFEVFLCFCCAT